jgi:hypothetical protein
MKNRKASERDRVIYEYALLAQPLESLAQRATAAKESDYRVAVAKVQAGDAQWRRTVREFTTFAADVSFADEFQDISHVAEHMLRRIKPHLEDPNMLASPSLLQEAVRKEVEAARASLFRFVDRVPIEWEPVVFPANTPFTAYLKIREATPPYANDSTILIDI